MSFTLHAPALAHPLSDQERSTLLRFEAVYEQWRVARGVLSAAEARLWAERLRVPPDGQVRARLDAETAALRVAATDAYGCLIRLLEGDEVQAPLSGLH